jgi:hypothetical protein
VYDPCCDTFERCSIEHEFDVFILILMSMKQRFTFLMIGSICLLIGILGLVFWMYQGANPLEGLYHWPFMWILLGILVSMLTKYRWPAAWVLILLGVVSLNWIQAPLPFGEIWVPILLMLIGCWHVKAGIQMSRKLVIKTIQSQ